MTKNLIYTDVDGRDICLGHLDQEERKLLAKLQNFARKHPDWTAFDNYWMKAVGEFYDRRGLTREESGRTVIFRIAQDISSRLGVACGLVRVPDYRDDLTWLIRGHFKTRRAFCRATGLTEDMLSHVLAGRKHLAIDTLIAALRRIGYDLRIMPSPLVALAPGKKKMSKAAV